MCTHLSVLQQKCCTLSVRISLFFGPLSTLMTNDGLQYQKLCQSVTIIKYTHQLLIVRFNYDVYTTFWDKFSIEALRYNLGIVK